MVSDEVHLYLSAIGRKGGCRGGRAKVRKGLALLSASRRREIALKGVQARRAKK